MPPASTHHGSVPNRDWGFYAAPLLSSLLALAANAAHASEGALGRVIPGTVLQSKAGIVPDVPVLALNLTSTYFDGKLSSSVATPIAGNISLGLETQLSVTTATLLKVWDTGAGRWNFASSLSVPYVWNRVEATLSVTGQSFGASDTASGLFDLYVVPLMAGYHFSETDHLALSFGIWAPTGNYANGSLANVGLNYWTFVPTMAYTKLVPDQGLELSGQVAVQVNTTNTATDYRSGSLLTVDGLALKSLGRGFSAGLALSWIEQISDDTGPKAASLDGFRGSQVGVGPVLAYTAMVGGKVPIDISFRWVPTVYSRNRIDGNTLALSISVPLGM